MNMAIDVRSLLLFRTAPACLTGCWKVSCLVIKKRAFTGADRNHQGMFDAAHNGILFLDEIGDLPLILQAKLLRVLQEQEIRPLGDTQYHKINMSG